MFIAVLPMPPRTNGSSYWELLNNPEQEATIFGNRARSATDANVLRRKGHLKEQDYLIDYMRRMHETHTCEEVRVWGHALIISPYCGCLHLSSVCCNP